MRRRTPGSRARAAPRGGGPARSAFGRRARRIRAVVIDGDGVLFTGRVFVHPVDGEVMKERSLIDGQALSLLRAAGVHVAFVSGESSRFLERVVDKLDRLPSVRGGAWPPIFLATGRQGLEKVAVVEEWLAGLGLTFAECAVLGDDLADVPLMARAALAVAPAGAEAAARRVAHWTTPRRGGDGAIRDFANRLLQERGVDPAALPLR